MEYITIQNTDLRVSRVCMGGCPMGGHGWGQVEDQELIRAVHAALDSGINFFDNADTYGLGHSEQILGRALAGNRDRAVIATKFGVRVEQGRTFYDNSPEYIIRACENSLRRLGTDRIDLYQVHYRDGVTPIGDILDAMELLRSQGKIRYFGLSNLKKDALAELAPHAGKFATVQNQYSLACRDLEEDILTLAEQAQLTPLTWGSLGQGILTGKYDSSVRFGSDDRRSRSVYVNFHGDKLLKNLKIVDTMRPIAAGHGRQVSAVAVRFILDHIPGSVVLCGAKRPDQIIGTAESLGWHLTARELAELEEVSR